MRKSASFLFILGFFLLIFGAKLWLIDRAGSDLPTWDQWDSEGEITLRPWLEGRLTAQDIFLPHNEHRIVTTKLYLLGLFVANGQWDAQVETTANAVIHTFAAVVLLLLARRWLGGAWQALFGALLFALFSLPFADDNTLVGFQVQFYFLLLFSLGHIALVLESDRFTWRWGLGQLCGALALLSMASGFFSSAAVLTVATHRLVRERRRTAQLVVTAGLALAGIALGLALKSGSSAGSLRAHGAGQFVHGFLQMLAWPGSAVFPWSLVLAAPFAVFAARRLKTPALPLADAVLGGLLAWIVLQFAATAYARNVSVLTSRYLDLVAVYVALGFVCLAREFSGRPRCIVAGLWLASVLAGLGYETRQRWVTESEPNIARQRRREAHVHAFLQTGDAAHLLGKPFGDIPYPSGELLRDRLQSTLQTVMPPSVRRPVPILSPAEVVPAALPPGLDAPAFISFVSTWVPAPDGSTLSWRSAMQPATTLPVLRLRVAGDLGAPGRALRLTVRSAAGAVPIVPDAAPGLRWKTVNVFRPPGEWWLEADDRDAGWFAFTAPVEVARGSWAAGKLLKHHRLILLAGLAALLAGAVAGRAASRSAASAPE